MFNRKECFYDETVLRKLDLNTIWAASRFWDSTNTDQIEFNDKLDASF